ncbi:acyl carrier protein [Streptomyces sp. NPDC048172]|uniref:acyl carrier protein n=1 Tax=Streptomyces sp. NPDC048172 TaxID=3365505 RepID=UPI00371561F7
MLKELLGAGEQPLAPDRPLGELGIDSLTAAQLSVEIEERTDITIPLERFLGEESLQDLVHEVENAAGATGEGDPSRGDGS